MLESNREFPSPHIRETSMRLNSLIKSLIVSACVAAPAYAQEAPSVSNESVVQANAAEAAPAQPKRSSVVPASAATYATYQADIGSVAGVAFTSKRQIEDTLETLGGHNAQRLSSGWISYSSLIAQQNTKFAEEVQYYEDQLPPGTFLSYLTQDPTYASRLKSSNSALRPVYAAAQADSSRMNSVARFFVDNQVSLQNQDWVKERIRDGADRAARLQNLSQAGRPISSTARQVFSAGDLSHLLSDAGASDMWDRMLGISSRAPSNFFTSFSTNQPTVGPEGEYAKRAIATLAALEVMSNQDDPVHASLQRRVMGEKMTERCFDDAQLQLRQCVETQSDHYGLQACMHQHAISDISSCVGKLAK